MFKSVKKILERNPVTASAPCRVDSGGTWDIKAFALPMAGVVPTTINIALTLRTKVTLVPFTEGRVRVSSQGFLRQEEYPADTVRFDSTFGLFFAALAHFAFHGLEVRIVAGSPVKAALGGSSTALIALIKALSDLSTHLGRPRLSSREILHLGYHLEDAVSPGKCGIQDQAAAVYGGVSRWAWQYVLQADAAGSDGPARALGAPPSRLQRKEPCVLPHESSLDQGLSLRKNEDRMGESQRPCEGAGFIDPEQGME